MAMSLRVVHYDVNELLAKNTKNYLKDLHFEVDTVDWDAVKSIFILLGLAHFISIIILLCECYILKKLSGKYYNGSIVFEHMLARVV